MKITRCILIIIGIGLAAGCSHLEPMETSARRASTMRAFDAGQLERYEDGEKYGFATQQGKKVIPAKYDNAREFSYGLAAVNIGAHWEFPGLKVGGQWGYINQQGEVVVPFTLDYAHKFSDGLARVVRNHETLFINTSGEIVIRCGLGSAGDFSEGLAAMESYAGHGTNHLWITEYINTQGNTVFNVQASGKEFHEGLAAAGVPNPRVPVGQNMGILYGFVDRYGNWAIEPTYAEVREFSEGLASVRPKLTTVYGKGDSWGYIDKSGGLAIGLQFNEAHSFYRGFALVHTGGELVLVLDGPSYWKGGKWMIIDRQGRTIKTSDKWIDVKVFADKRAERH